MDLEKYVTLGEDGKLKFDNNAFTADLDREKTSAINTYSANNSKKVEEEIRKKLEEEAKLSAEEKLKADREAFEAEKIAVYKELAQSKAKTKLENANLFDKTEVEAYLELVSKDEDLGKIDKLISARTKVNADYEKSLREKILSETPNPAGGNAGAPDDTGARFAKEYQAKQVAENTKTTAFSGLM
jgi:hypothetical protein